MSSSRVRRLGRSRRGHTEGPLQSGAFRAFFIAHAVSVFGDALMPVALAFAVLNDGLPVSAIGIVFIARVLPIGVLTLLGGVWADRHSRLRIMVSSHVVRFASQGVMGGLLIAGRPSLVTLVGLQVVHGAATALFRPAAAGVVPQLVPKAALQAANGLIRGALSLSFILGPLLAGILVAAGGAGWALVLDALTFGVAAVLLLRIRNLGSVEAGAERSSWEALRASWRALASRRWLWTGTAYFSLFNLLYLPALVVIGPAVADQSLGGAKAWALIMAATGLGTLLGNALSMRIEPTRPLPLAILLMACSIPTLVLLALAVPVAVIALAEFAAGTAFGVAGPLWDTVVQREVPQELLSRVRSFDILGAALFRPVGLGLAGFLAGAMNARSSLLLAAVLTMFATFAVIIQPAVWRPLEDMRRTRAADMEPEPAD
jgi:predicted MFS family arabinose efflux permease